MENRSQDTQLLEPAQPQGGDARLKSDIEALRGVSETLLITLAGRARGTKEAGVAGFRDPKSLEICATYDVDLNRYAQHRPTMLGVVHRGAWFDGRCIEFLQRHPEGAVLHLGAGLNTAYERVRAHAPDGSWMWIDTDLTPVIDIRRRLFEEDDRRTHQVLDATDPGALDAALEGISRPVLVLSEGVIMYLTQKQVETLLATLANYSELEFLFDWISPLGMRQSRKHPAVKRIKDDSVVFQSSFKRADDIRAIDPRWSLITEGQGLNRRLGLGVAMMSAIFGLMTGGRQFYGLAHAKVES